MEVSEMDQFDVPKVVNQNVLQALDFLQSERPNFYTASEIAIQVEKQMENFDDVDVLHNYVRESLSNLTEMGLLVCTGSADYCLQHSLAPNEEVIGDQNELAETESATGQGSEE